MAKYGVRVPPGIACTTSAEVAEAAAKLGGDSGEVVVKSQVRGTPRIDKFNTVGNNWDTVGDWSCFEFYPHP